VNKFRALYTYVVLFVHDNRCMCEYFMYVSWIMEGKWGRCKFEETGSHFLFSYFEFFFFLYGLFRVTETWELLAKKTQLKPSLCIPHLQASPWRNSCLLKQNTRRQQSKRTPVRELHTVFNIVYIFIFNCKWVFTRWQWYYNKTQHTNNTHHTK
jgi:hypothetical protein